jgi:hypothetical protein
MVVLGAVIFADLVVFIGLCRDEIADWGRATGPGAKEVRAPFGARASAPPRQYARW